MIPHTESDTIADQSFELTMGAYTFTHDWKTDGSLWIRIVDALESVPIVDTLVTVCTDGRVQIRQPEDSYVD